LAVDSDNTLAALKFFGGTPEQLETAREQLRQRQENLQFGVWPENWRAFELFCLCQWTILPASFGGRPYYDGIASTELESLERRFPPTDDTELPTARVLCRQLRILVDTAKEHLNEG
jgi:hypothetical protein